LYFPTIIATAITAGRYVLLAAVSSGGLRVVVACCGSQLQMVAFTLYDKRVDIVCFK
jgi:hypothetical protein